MKFSSTIQILMTEVSLTKKLNPETGKPYEIPYARCILLGDDFKAVTVGRLNIPRDMEGKVREGIFRAGFALVVPDYGNDKGDIVARLIELTEIPASAMPKVKPLSPVVA